MTSCSFSTAWWHSYDLVVERDLLVAISLFRHTHHCERHHSETGDIEKPGLSFISHTHISHQAKRIRRLFFSDFLKVTKIVFTVYL